MGKLIVIEGTDCSFKETQSVLLEKTLNEIGIKCKRFTFPVYDSPTGKIVGGYYLGKEEIAKSLFLEGPSNVDPYVSCLYYAADRKYNIKKVEKFLNEGYTVILDRYTTSNMAHQGGKIYDQEERFHMYQWIDKLEFWLLKLPKPDLTIFLHMPYEYAYSLKKKKNPQYKDKEYLKNAEEAYIELSELYHWDRIECIVDHKMRSIENIHQEIIDLIKKNMNYC